MSPAGSQIVMLLAMAARMALSVGMTILLGRSLAPAEFGFFSLVATVFGLAHELTDMGTGNVAVRMATRGAAGERAMLETLMGLRLILSLVAAAACLILAVLQDAAWKQWSLAGTALILGFSYVSALAMSFQIRQAQVAPALLSVGVQLGAVAVSAAMLRLRVNGAYFAMILLLREAAVVAGTPLLGRRLLGYHALPRISLARLQPFFGRAVIVATATLFYHVQLQGGPFFVEFLRPPAELGAFAAALRPLIPLLFIPWIIMLPLVPVLSWLANGHAQGFRRQAEGAVDLSIGLGAVTAVACALLAPAALHVLYGARFAEGALSAVAALRWLSVPLGCSFLVAAMSTILLADHREGALLAISAVALAVYAAANMVLLPGFGFVGSAIATTLSIFLLTLAGWALMARSRRGFAPHWRTLLIMAPAVGLASALRVVGGAPLSQLAIGAVLSGAALLAVWWFPGLPAYRAEQADMARRLLEDV
jgi:O-antigen/teichoic acid export membrane protein